MNLGKDEKNIIDTLESLGLNDKEIQIYLAALEVGTSPASLLGKRTGIQRSTAQYTCHQLSKKGLLNGVEKGNAIMYTAESPEKLLILIERENEKLQQKYTQTEQIIGLLKKVQNPHLVMPKVKFYEGRQGMIDLYDAILAKGESIDSFEDKGEMEQFIPDYVHEFIGYRKKHKIHNRVICPAINSLNKSTPEEFRETRTIDEKEFPFTCDIKICGDQVSIFSFDAHQPVGIAIKHQNIVHNFQLLFDYMWKLLGERKKVD